MPISLVSSRVDFFSLATTRVNSGPRMTSTPIIIAAILTTPVRYQPGHRYQPRYRAVSTSSSAPALDARCSPNALNLNPIDPNLKITAVRYRPDHLREVQ